MSGDNLAVVSKGGRGVYGIEWVEARDAAKDPTVHRRALFPQLRIIWPQMSIVPKL